MVGEERRGALRLLAREQAVNDPETTQQHAEGEHERGD